MSVLCFVFQCYKRKWAQEGEASIYQQLYSAVPVCYPTSRITFYEMAGEIAGRRACR